MKMLKLVLAFYSLVAEQEGLQVVAIFGLMQSNPKLKHYERFIAIFWQPDCVVLEQKLCT